MQDQRMMLGADGACNERLFPSSLACHTESTLQAIQLKAREVVYQDKTTLYVKDSVCRVGVEYDCQRCHVHCLQE